MEDPILKNSSTENQNGSVSLSVDREGLLNSTGVFPLKDISPENKENLEILINNESSKEINGYINIDCMTSTNSESELVEEKTYSPTLIESAIKVMKNLFSPEKAKSNSTSSLSPNNSSKSAPGSPSISTSFPGKTELFASEPGNENCNNQLTPGENNLKHHSLNNELEQLQTPLNNTDESFMTTVSLIDDSFHSAVTNLDEHGEFLRNGINLEENMLNNSQNLMDPNNDTLENNDSCLENTMLRIDNFSSYESKLSSFPAQNQDKFMKNFSCINPHVESSFLNGVETASVNQFQSSSGSTQNERKSGILVLQNLTEINSNGKTAPEKHSDEMNNVKIADIYFNESFPKETPSEQSKIFANDFGENMVKETEKLYGIKTENDKINEIQLEYSNGRGICVVSSISTTTVVLNPGNSNFEKMFMSVKTDDSDTNISTLTLEGSDEMCLLQNDLSESDINCSVSSNVLFSSKQKKRSCVSEGNSPKKWDSSEMKLNKSDELLNRRILSESFESNEQTDNSSVDFLLMKYSEASKISEKTYSVEYSQNCKKRDGLEENGNKVHLTSNEVDPVALTSQQSYTILNVHNKSLNRPVIEPINMNCDPSNQQGFQKNDSDPVPGVKRRFVNNSCNGSFDSEDLVKSSQVKQSTPLWEGRNETGTKFSRPATLTLHSPEIPESICGATKVIENLGDKNSLTEKGKQIFSTNETGDGFSPVESTGDVDLFMNSVKDEKGTKHRSPCEEPKNKHSPALSKKSNKSPKETVARELNQTFDKKPQSPKSQNEASNEKTKSRASHPFNQTFEKKATSPGSNSKSRSQDSSHSTKWDKLNETFDINKGSPKSNKTFTKETRSPKIDEANLTFNRSKSPENALLNKTYDKPFNNQLNQTFSKETEKLNETFDKKSKSPISGKMIKVSDKIPESSAPIGSNQTFVLENSCLEEPGQESYNVDAKDCEILGSQSEEINKTFEEKTEILKPLRSDGQPHLISPFLNPAVLNYRTNNDIECGSHGDPNDSFVSTRSSNASLFCSDLSTVVFNEEDCADNRSINDLSGKLGKMDLNENGKKDSGVCFATVEEQNFQTENTLFNSLKDEKLRCDPEIVQLIQEQFSSNDIEKICSVVQDFSSIKLTNDILKASEQFDKSFHGNVSEIENKHLEVESNSEKAINALSPQSFDFLNSIGGKPTGRDLSRESLYVKFDPLVQPSANSLIDFTKEGEALATIDASPVNPLSSSICEQLLTISPQKKPDVIVPPLTPLSHKVKPDPNEDNLERLKELQNEIYFLKNLYAEREKSNKAKIEDYESQIAKLTGESCMLEDKLKDSNEREKSLVKKLKERTHSIGQLKIIMEEYVKVISKLSLELETIKNENVKQLESLSVEKDSYMTHLQNTEAAFTDVHAKYEKSKKTIVSLKANETLYRNTISEQSQKMEELKSRAREAQEKALMGFQKIQEELNQTKATHSQEVARLKAQLRKTELKVEALQESLDQKIKENQQLTAICDELIEGKK